ncbi:MAG: acetylornithine deacetylase [Pseudomonadales bacterium]|nr:acetylornithine deacetylase [Pseudomonadales bacterium]
MPAHFPDMLTHFDALLRLPSISSANTAIDMSNGAVIDYLAEAFAALGFNCEIIASDSTSSQRKYNLIATLGSGPGGLVLSGHTDTVPMDEALWQVPPLQLTQKDNRLYGLGSTDMKGFFALVMEAVRQLQPKNLQQPLIVLATADEESSMSGARTLAAQGRPKARYAVIGEPTGLRPVRAHKGIMMETIRLQGRSGHSSDPALGRNALEAMHAVISEMLLMRTELQQRYQNSLFTIPVPTMNLGCIHGGDNANRICGQCELEFDIRLLPGMHIDELRAELNNRLIPIANSFEVGFELVPQFPGAMAFHTPAESELVRTTERLTGHTATSVAFGTEGPLLQQIGLETLILGPGDIDQAHQPDEFLALDRVTPYLTILQELIRIYCLKPSAAAP